MSSDTSLESLRKAWRKRAGGATTLAFVALLITGVLAGAHVARLGTPAARIGAAGALVIVAVWFAVRSLRERRDWRTSRGTVARVLLPADEALGRRALRALGLIDRTQADPASGSAELAELHFDRLVRRASVDAIEAAASRHAQWYRGIAVAVMLAGVAAALLSPVRVVEGMNVLFATGGRAPVRMALLRYPRIVAQPPTYTRQPDRTLVFGGSVALPKGTTITVRGIPRHEGRELVISDGEQQVPFVSDGSGGVVARYTVSISAEVRVAARYGDVLIEAPDPLNVIVVADAPPRVVLEGAPRTLKLAEADRIEIRWLSEDDHGLRQVDLVLRSGTREDRRALGRYDGQSKVERGGHVLLARDTFMRRMFLPISITVQAKDNDPFDGPKWGISEAIIAVPPAVGEPEARRYAALVDARSALVDLLAWRTEVEALKDPTLAREKLSRAGDRVRKAVKRVQDAVEGSYGGLSVPRGLKAYALGQAENVEGAVKGGRIAQEPLERAVLALDVAIRSLGARDAAQVAKRLGDVAEEAATGARLARESENRAPGVERLDASLDAIERGAKELLGLGALGRDLGSVAQSELRRIRRARRSEDMMHAELAALHLAARLRRPNPSFGAAGGRGGVESGMGRGGSAEAGVSPSDADQRFDQLAEEVSRLAREHGDSLEAVEQALREAAEQSDLESLRQEAEERAQRLRGAVRGLPPPGQPPGSRQSAEALAREHASAMAHGLEQLSLDAAVESGANAISALEDALGKPGSESSNRRLEEVRKEVREQLDWARGLLERLRSEAEQRARAPLDQAGQRERDLAERAGELADKGGDAAMPDDITDRLERAQSVMREAARALAEGRGDEGLKLQREAQRLLEHSDTGRTTETEDSSPRQRQADRRPSEGDGDGRLPATGGEVPEPTDAQRAEEFRQRVLRGLGEEKSDRLAPAIRRYAEGLLR